MTEFKPIPGLAPYSVSIDGQLRNDLTGLLHKAAQNRTGYIKYSVAKHTMLAHRAVALAWIGPPPIGKPCVAHLDGTRSNNHVSNLAWASYSENEKHKDGHGTHLRGERGSATKLTDSKVAQMRREYSNGASINSIAKRYGISGTSARDAISGRSWSHIPNAIQPRNFAARGQYVSVPRGELEFIANASSEAAIRDKARSMLNYGTSEALEPASGEYVLVPREPTRAMIDAGVAFALSVSLSGEYRWSQYVADLHKTMLTAATSNGSGK